MRKIRIKNDINVTLSIKRDGSIEDLTGKDLAIVMQVGYLKAAIEDFTVDGNKVGFLFPALQQKHTGVYSITIQVRDGDAVNTVDKCDAFELVSCSCNVGGTDEPNIETVSLEYSLDLKTDTGGSSSGGGGTGDYRDLANKPKINGITLDGNNTLGELGIQPEGEYLTKQDIPDLKGKDGKSAYQIWIDAGNSGTEEDFLVSLKGADGKDGKDGTNGVDGTDGVNGIDGHTPVKGVDYFTSGDVSQIVNDVTAAISGQIDGINDLVGTEGGEA